MKGSEFVFDYVQLLSCKCNEINPNHDGSYIDKKQKSSNTSYQ